MANKVSLKDIPAELKYEPGFELRFGITDEFTDTKHGTLGRTHFPAKSNSKTHLHANGDMVWYCISGTAIWLIGEEKKEVVTEPGDFMYIPRGEIHSTINRSTTEPVEGVGGYFGCSNPFKSGKKFI
ncbi:MAG: cupin domain-containing protein [Candidatus Zixiibacteriota bacterium]